MQTLYQILNISTMATPDEIKEAYRKQCFQYHPDHGGDAEIFLKITEAYHVLSDKSQRDKYDYELMENINLQEQEALEGSHTTSDKKLTFLFLLCFILKFFGYFIFYMLLFFGLKYLGKYLGVHPFFSYFVYCYIVLKIQMK